MKEDIEIRTYFSWKFIPLLFILSLLLECLVVLYVSIALPDFMKVGFPTNFEKAQELAHILSQYLSTNFFTLLVFQVTSFLFLQTWCIPGTFLFNLLGGALFGIYLGFPICLACNVIGALFCFLISKYFAAEIIDKRFHSKLLIVKEKLSHHQKDLFFYMTSLRIFPGSPNWFMNISFPHLKIPIHYFVPSIAVGLIPWNFMTCLAGLKIKTFRSKDEIMQPSNYLFLFALGMIFLLPPIIKKIFRKKDLEKLL